MRLRSCYSHSCERCVRSQRHSTNASLATASYDSAELEFRRYLSSNAKCVYHLSCGANDASRFEHYEPDAAEFDRRPHRSRISRTLFLAARRLALALSMASSVTTWALPVLPS